MKDEFTFVQSDPVVVIIEYKSCDSVRVDNKGIHVMFHNKLTNNYWQKTYQAADLSVDQILKWKNGITIQRAMPGLDANDREHFLTGLTQKEINETFGEG
jgi:trans-aconitate methyltransferase